MSGKNDLTTTDGFEYFLPGDEVPFVILNNGKVLDDVIILDYSAEKDEYLLEWFDEENTLCQQYFKKAEIDSFGGHTEDFSFDFDEDSDEDTQPIAVDQLLVEKIPLPTIRVTERTERKEVPRTREVMSIGDLHGSMEALWANLEALCLVDDNHEWIGEDRELVFLGDILADRATYGLEIIMTIRKLRGQAITAGGNIHVLSGNHDNWMIAYLMGMQSGDELDPLEQAKLGLWNSTGPQGAGMIELNQFLDKYLGRQHYLPKIDFFAFWDLKKKHDEVRKNMLEHAEGKILLEEMCKMQIAEQIDDALFVHTDINFNMANMIIEHGVDYLNEIFQKELREVLLEGKPAKQVSAEFRAIINTFLATDNRSVSNMSEEKIALHLGYGSVFPAEMTEEQAEKLREMGINNVIHGHTEAYSFGRQVNGVLVQSIDMHAYKYDGYKDRRSIGVVREDGRIEVGKDFQVVVEA